jgi:hypothetical protein
MYSATESGTRYFTLSPRRTAVRILVELTEEKVEIKKYEELLVELKRSFEGRTKTEECELQ